MYEVMKLAEWSFRTPKPVDRLVVATHKVLAELLHSILRIVAMDEPLSAYIDDVAKAAKATLLSLLLCHLRIQRTQCCINCRVVVACIVGNEISNLLSYAVLFEHLKDNRRNIKSSVFTFDRFDSEQDLLPLTFVINEVRNDCEKRVIIRRRPQIKAIWMRDFDRCSRFFRRFFSSK